MKKIKDVIELSGLSRRTLQYYDDEGLMDNSRTAENYRLYESDDLQRLWEIILYKEMGFHLDEIHALLNADESEVNVLLKLRTASIENEIVRLNRILDFMNQVIEDGLPAMDEEALGSGMTMSEMARKVSRGL